MLHTKTFLITFWGVGNFFLDKVILREFRVNLSQPREWQKYTESSIIGALHLRIGNKLCPGPITIHLLI